MPGKPQFVTLRRTAPGVWEATFQCSDVPLNPFPSTNKSVGIDVGLKTFATLSDGVTYENPRFFRRAQRHLKKVQRKASRTVRTAQRLREAETGKPCDSRAAHRLVASGYLTKPSDYGTSPQPPVKRGSNRQRCKYDRSNLTDTLCA